LNIDTCKPVPNILFGTWRVKATGYYAVHHVPCFRLVNEKPQIGGKRTGMLSAFPRAIDEETWPRSAWPTGKRGVVQLATVFPGYYTGRATHIHTNVFSKWIPLPTGTFKASRLSHTGPFFFGDKVNLNNPIRRTRCRTKNWGDSLNIFEAKPPH
ncbi:hypothetical protein BKA70DRAFT_1102325, partial [Coprinopsis sp. MPI-PUGE-AT-0042]